MSESLKQKVIREYKDKKKKEEEEEKRKEEEKNIEEIVDKIIKKKEKGSTESDTVSDESELTDEEERFNKKEITTETPPYLYIDYDLTSLNAAINSDYNIVKVEKDGLTESIINDILSEKYCKLNKTNVIINLWRVLTKSSLSSFSHDCEKVDLKKFKNKIETTYKWGSKGHLKENMNDADKDEYSLFRDGIDDFFKKLKKEKVNIFIVSNSHNLFIKRILEHYKLDKYIEKIFTPSNCGLPDGIIAKNDSLKDGRKMNRERAFACIERYIGRLPRN